MWKESQLSAEAETFWCYVFLISIWCFQQVVKWRRTEQRGKCLSRYSTPSMARKLSPAADIRPTNGAP